MHEHGACQPTPSKHHSHARCVHLEAAMPNEPHPDDSSHQAYGSIEQGRPSTAGREENIKKRGTACLKHAGIAPCPGSPFASLAHLCTRDAQAHPSRGVCLHKPSTGVGQQHWGIKPCTGCLGLAMHRHCIGSRCHVLIMGVRVGSPCMELSHDIADIRQGRRTMPGIPQLSHASALCRQQMPRAYHGCSHWQLVHGAQPPFATFACSTRPQRGAGASNHARFSVAHPHIAA